MSAFSPKWLRHPAAKELLRLAGTQGLNGQPPVPARVLVNHSQISSRWPRDEAATVLQALAEYGYFRRGLSSAGTMLYGITADGVIFRDRLENIPPSGFRAALDYWRGQTTSPLQLALSLRSHLQVARSFDIVQGQRLEPGSEHQGTPEAAAAPTPPPQTPLPQRPAQPEIGRVLPELPGPGAGTFG